MTAVGGFVSENRPLMVGDLLLSSDIARDSTIREVLPTTNLIPDEINILLRGLRQKIAIIGGHVLIGWAGKLSVAQDVISKLVQMNDYEPLTIKSINKCLGEERATVWTQIGLIGFILGDTDTSAFCRSAWTVPSPHLQYVRLIGSGRDALGRHLRENSKLPEYPPDLNVSTRAVFRGLTVTGGFGNIQIHTGEGLSEFYGGGYELATLNGGRFEKVGDVTYVFWRAKYVSDDEIYLTDTPKRAFRFDYVGDDLIIRSLEPTNAIAFRKRRFLIPPVYAKPKATDGEQLSLPDFNGQWLCNYIVVESEDKPPAIISMITLRADRTSQVHFFEHNDEMTFSVDEKFIHGAQKAVREYPQFVSR